MISEILIILFLLVLNGVFAMAEIATFSARRARLQQLSEEGDTRATQVLKLLETPQRFLSTTQIGITLVGIFAGAFGAASFSPSIAEWIAYIPFLSFYKEQVAFAIVVLIITYFSLLIGELVPKQIALTDPERVAGILSTPMRYLATLTSPLVDFMSFSSSILIRLLGIKPTKDQVVTEDEFKILLEQGTQAGVFEETEQEMVSRVLSLGDRRVSSMMTPRTDLVWIDIHDPIETQLLRIVEGGHSYYPVCNRKVDDVIGIASVKALGAFLMKGEKVDLRGTLLDPMVVPETVSGLQLLERFKKEHKHFALVVDEWGGTSGVITLNDLMEALVGELEGSSEPAEAKAVQRTDGSWLLSGWISTHDFDEILGESMLLEDNSDTYETLAGFVIYKLGRIPAAADFFDFMGYRFEVMDMDGQRVDKVLVAKLPEPVPAAEETDDGE